MKPVPFVIKNSLICVPVWLLEDALLLCRPQSLLALACVTA